MVPVDFVVDATDTSRTAPTRGSTSVPFHRPTRRRCARRFAQHLCRAAHAPQMTMRINAALFGFIRRACLKGMMALPPVRRIKNAVMKDLGIPDDVLGFINYPVRFDCRDTLKALEGKNRGCRNSTPMPPNCGTTGERNLDPDLFIDRTLKGRSKAK